MSEKLTPLEAFKRFRNNLKWLEENIANLKGYFENKELCFKEDLAIIETALKDYEKKTKLAKEYADVNNVAKRLKALEIIKDKQVILFNFNHCKSVKEYNRVVRNLTYAKQLTEKEFNSLKEILK